MKTIFIQINNNSQPEKCGKDIEVLDCRCINDFCSFVSDAMIGDLKDDNGKPFYRLINPIGKLLMDFKTIDEDTFSIIIENWYGILGDLLNKGKQEDDIKIKFPQQYVDWLLCNDNVYYAEIGKCLQKNDGKVFLDADGISEEIISALHKRILRFLRNNKVEYSYVVFSNPSISNSSVLIKELEEVFDHYKFLRYALWISNLEEIKKEKDEEVFNVGGVEFRMIRVDGGTFTMGASPEQFDDAWKDEIPNHLVTLSSYWIGKTEVTQDLWQTVMGSNPSFYKGAKRPVEWINWDDCQEFIRKLNAATGRNFRLPTEAEWEFAARGGNKSKGHKYCGSNNLDEVAWYDENSNQTQNVATKKANELDLYDMSGNVYEWCNDWHGNYSSSSQTSPQGPNSGQYRVIRGGSYLSDTRFCRSSFRAGFDPSKRDREMGLRLVLSE